MSEAGLRRGLLDTAGVPAIQTGLADAVQFALDILKTQPLEICELSAMGLLASAQDPAEHAGRLLFLRHNHVNHLTARISRRAFALLVSRPVPSPLTAGGAFVAATAVERSLPPDTLDPTRLTTLPGLVTILA